MFQTVAGVTRTSQRTHTRADDVKDAYAMNFGSHIFAALNLGAGLSFAMVWLAARVNMIELRRPVKCPACGRLRRAGSCGCNS
jgi:hypothetical protein